MLTNLAVYAGYAGNAGWMVLLPAYAVCASWLCCLPVYNIYVHWLATFATLAGWLC
jgi:hypothetical protein